MLKVEIKRLNFMGYKVRLTLWGIKMGNFLTFTTRNWMTCCALFVFRIRFSCVQSARIKNNADITMIVGPRELQRVMEHFLGSVNDRFPSPLPNMSKLHNHIRWFGTNAIVACFGDFVSTALIEMDKVVDRKCFSNKWYKNWKRRLS